MFIQMKQTQCYLLLKSINEIITDLVSQYFKIDFNVPLLLEAKIGDNWLDTKDVL